MKLIRRIFGITGCLDDKTPEMKEEYFRNLSDFVLKDKAFFTEQYNDLLRHEKKEFKEWAMSDLELTNNRDKFNMFKELTINVEKRK